MKSEARKASAKPKIRIVYVTSSEYKQQENDVFVRHCMIDADNAVRDIFEFDIRPVPIQEILNVDLKVMVSAEAVSAYRQVASWSMLVLSFLTTGMCPTRVG